MKFIALVFLASTMVFAQTAPKVVPVTDQEKQALDLAQTKLQNYQFQANNLQAQMKDLGDKFQAEQKVYNDALEAARKAHSLDDSATFDVQNFTFTVYPTVKKVEPKK